MNIGIACYALGIVSHFCVMECTREGGEGAWFNKCFKLTNEVVEA